MNKPARYTLLFALAVLALFLVPGCHNDDESFYVDRTPPTPPRGLFTLTGDGRVDIYWIENTEEDFAGYRVYWNDEPTGAYDYMATTANAHYTDYDVVNGTTYYYAISAYDRGGNESELSFETVSDTPRPEGFDLVLYDYLGSSSALSGFDFSAYHRQLYSLASTDIFYGYVDGMHVMYAWNPNPDWPSTDIQDAGYRDLDEADDAPPDGWTADHLVILTEGHSYFVWTRDNHFAKFYVKQIGAGFVALDWAYQTAIDNPELAQRKLGLKGGGTAPDPSQPSEIGGVVR